MNEDEQQPIIEDPDEQIAAANQARIQYLSQHGIPVPVDQMYMVSLLEFILDDDQGSLAAAKRYHDRRVAPILDSQIGRLHMMAEQAQSQRARQELLRPLGT